MKKSQFLLIIAFLGVAACESKRQEELIIGRWRSLHGLDKSYEIVQFYKDSTGIDRVFDSLGAPLSVNRFKYKIFHDQKVLELIAKGQKPVEAEVKRLMNDTLILNHDMVYYRIHDK